VIIIGVLCRLKYVFIISSKCYVLNIQNVFQVPERPDEGEPLRGDESPAPGDSRATWYPDASTSAMIG